MKRARSFSAGSSSSSSSAGSATQPSTAKYRRTDLLPQPTDSRLTCQLPPTCSESSNTFNSPAELQTHYDRCHLHICQAEGCNKVFPDARLLELHEIENHDPFASEQQRAGEKIFECFLPKDVCGKRCATPRGRRNHMIQIHHFSKQYFFSVTNHGIGDMVKRFGPGASMIRPEWKGPPKDVPPTEALPSRQQASTTLLGPVTDGSAPTDATMGDHTKANVDEANPKDPSTQIDIDMEALTGSLATTSLGLVPPSVARKQKKKAQQT